MKISLLFTLCFIAITSCTSKINIYNKEGRMFAEFNRTANSDFKIANIFISRGLYKDAEIRYFEVYNAPESEDYRKEHKEEALYLLSELYLLKKNPYRDEKRSQYFLDYLLIEFPDTEFID